MTTLRLRSIPRLALSLSLLTVFLAACAAGTATNTSAPPDVVVPSATIPATDAPGETTGSPTEAVAATAIPVATSRGPDLHATDPSTVRLASGGLQLVEFFRFT